MFDIGIWSKFPMQIPASRWRKGANLSASAISKAALRLMLCCQMMEVMDTNQEQRSMKSHDKFLCPRCTIFQEHLKILSQDLLRMTNIWGWKVVKWRGRVSHVKKPCLQKKHRNALFSPSVKLFFVPQNPRKWNSLAHQTRTTLNTRLLVETREILSGWMLVDISDSETFPTFTESLAPKSPSKQCLMNTCQNL